MKPINCNIRPIIPTIMLNANTINNGTKIKQKMLPKIRCKKASKIETSTNQITSIIVPIMPIKYTS